MTMVSIPFFASNRVMKEIQVSLVPWFIRVEVVLEVRLWCFLLYEKNKYLTILVLIFLVSKIAVCRQNNVIFTISVEIYVYVLHWIQYPIPERCLVYILI